MTKTQIVWFKRDLRVHDHAPLAAACASGEPVLALYIFEPEMWVGPDSSARQLKFLRESLTELQSALEERGAQLVIRTGAAEEVLAQLHRDFGVAAIHTYRDSQSGAEGQRNDTVRRWTLRAGISLREQDTSSLLTTHSGNSGDWQGRWYARMSARRLAAPEYIYGVSARSETIDALVVSHFGDAAGSTMPPGGRSNGVRLLRRAFIAGDAHTFRDIVRALKLHLMYGTVSVREAYQAAMRAKRVGMPGQSVTYAETLMERLKDMCERGHRLERRAMSRPFGTFGSDTCDTLPEPEIEHAPASQNNRATNDQMSFDFRSDR